MMSDFNIAAYLRRIGYAGDLSPAPATLRELQVAHLITVPFENLSIHNGEPIVLDDAALFQKIVVNHRGGFCYEANGLFATLLRELGFEVVMLSARVANASAEFSPEFDHMALMVTLDQPWLVDVGFGDSFLMPIAFNSDGIHSEGDTSYKVTKLGSNYLLLRRDEADWKPQYRFSLQPYQYADYEPRCLFHQTSPDSHFTRGRICSLATKDGRITLSELRLIRTSGHGIHKIRQERSIADEAEFAHVLRGEFGVVLGREGGSTDRLVSGQ